MREDIPLDAPIPGMSLTHELGARPWQTPPKAATVAEAMETYLPAFQNEDVVPEILNVLETGIPVAAIAEATMFKRGDIKLIFKTSNQELNDTPLKCWFESPIIPALFIKISIGLSFKKLFKTLDEFSSIKSSSQISR